MRKLKLNVKERGHLIEIPGLPAFRSPAKVDITNIKLQLVLTTLKNLGIKDYEITSKDDKEEIINTRKGFGGKEVTKNTSDELLKINERFDKLEKILSLLSEKDSKNTIPEEQITKKLNSLELLTKKILEKESVKEIIYSDKKSEPIVEELEDSFIPDIDISDLKMKGETSKIKVEGDVDEAEEAAELLSRLGGK